MGKVFMNLTCEELCDLMCGRSEDEESGDNMNKDKVLQALVNEYNAKRDDIIRVYDLQMSERRGKIDDELEDVLAIEVCYIEKQEKLANEFIKAIKEVFNNK